LRVHLTEAYRLHRRMLRTRRRFLRELADRAGQPLPERKAAPPAYEKDPRLSQLWAALDDWRTHAVAESAGRPVEQRLAAREAYFRLAQVLVSDRSRLAAEAEARRSHPLTPAGERQSLRRLATLAQSP